MFVYNFKENKLPNVSNLKANINTEMFLLENQIDTTDKKEESIYKNFINLSIYSCLNFENASILNDFNNAFTSSSEILEKLKAQKSRLEAIKKLIDRTPFTEEEFNQDEFLNNLQELLEDYYEYKNSIQRKVIEENNKLDKLVNIINKCQSNTNSAIKTPKVDIEEKKPEQAEPKININEISRKVDIKPKSIEIKNVDIETKESAENIELPEEDVPKALKKGKFIPIDTPNEEPIETPQKPSKFNLTDNRTLTISKKDEKVYLPYFATDLQQTLLKSDYETYDELIQNDYVFPLKKFKSPTISRFKEGYRLMREKEYESLGTSVSFGLKLMKIHKLHPAVISACRNIDELNCFLDCLDDGSLDSFDIFDIKFDIPPTKT